MEARRSSQSAGAGGRDAERSTTDDSTSNVQQDDKKPSSTPSPQQQQQQPQDEKKPSKLKQIWTKIGLDVPTLVVMFKGSIPPIVALAMYQADAVAQEYTTLGYLVAITSILGFCIMPRGKFIQTMTLNVLAVCLSAAVNLLALYCGTQARKHTTPPGRPLAGYNSSANAVLAIWLMVQIYLINVVRAARPQFQFPAIIYSIFVIVSSTYGVMFPTMTYALSFMQRLLEAFLTGFAIATATHFVIFPTSSRKVVLKEMTGYMMCLGGMLKAQTAYMASLENLDPVQAREERERQAAAKGGKKEKKNQTSGGVPLATPALTKLKETLGKTMELHTKLHGDITPAKREFAIGKLESHDLSELWRLMKGVFVPVIGLSSSIDLLNRVASENDWAHEGATEDEKRKRHEQVGNVQFLMKQLHQPFFQMTGEIDAAIKHVLITLELTKPEKKRGDEESSGDILIPGSNGFSEGYKRKVDAFYKSKEKTLEDWCKEHDIELPEGFFEGNSTVPESLVVKDDSIRDRYQRQLFFTLYLEYLLYRASRAMLDLTLFVDKRKQEGALKRSKLVFPGSRTLYKWLKATVGKEDLSKDSHIMTDLDAGGSEAVYLGDSFGKKKDPEHLPPRNAIERGGEILRAIPNFFRSDASSFGLRTVAATMTIAIVCYLEESQQFFLRQRLLWAMIMVAISMTRTAGQSIWNFVLRIVGTAVAMVGAYIIWYIVVGHTAGVLVFLWLWIACAFYFVVKFPKLIIVAILSLVTAVLIIGYELQVDKIGVQASESNGQPAYPTYELAPYRLATVVGGLFVAFIWTVFPFPISESSELRKDLGASLYLLSNYYAVTHEAVQARVKGIEGDAAVKGTHAYHLEKASNAVFSKLLLLLTHLKQNKEFSKFQLQVGGRFPREHYEALIEICQRLLQYIALISYSSTTFSVHRGNVEISQWSNDFRKIITSVSSTSHQITSVLSLLSSSLHNGQALPPYIELPKPYQFLRKLESIDPDLLSIRHIAEPEYSAFAVITICAQAINRDLAGLLEHVKALVGETDFSFQAFAPSSASTDSDSVDSGEAKEKAN
ncbi:hypothetical protein KC315_g12015 [Hortaea werneckii]|uniref:ER transporter 6TM N-terminal domain-containing protein n=1 Tax=Hortaea werneckii TaxID=91943 RepID=A0A3M7AWL4_HORWE|nr:hypothetical protein KC315_g12015 [Hortaea werneckii]KAI7344319.1 hypothetical protein KC354_g15227 [Hortaea werneckii]KAI7538369.1 hypothetical protein KC331_g10402 [Hortaea werneckii]KAI7710222.1 hypothetical protein KC353_g9861 [Hortaea werneckii]RMY31886.1 hypothetical protein D0865_14878 [Hortaea werneckii]